MFYNFFFFVYYCVVFPFYIWILHFEIFIFRSYISKDFNFDLQFRKTLVLNYIYIFYFDDRVYSRARKVHRLEPLIRNKLLRISECFSYIKVFISDIKTWKQNENLLTIIRCNKTFYLVFRTEYIRIAFLRMIWHQTECWCQINRKDVITIQI